MEEAIRRDLQQVAEVGDLDDGKRLLVVFGL